MRNWIYGAAPLNPEQILLSKLARPNASLCTRSTLFNNARRNTHKSLPLHPNAFSVLVQEIVQIVVVPAALPPLHRDFLRLLLLLTDRIQDVLELRFRDSCSQLSAPRQHDEPVLDIFRARGLDQSDPP